MADEENWKVGGRGAFQLGRQYAEVGPDLGRLYEARHTGNGRSSLLLVPGEGMAWQPEGFWRVSLCCYPSPASLTLEVERAPASVSAKELANILVLMSAAVERVDDSPEAHAHLVRSVVHAPDPWRTRARRTLLAGGARALMVLSVLVLGVGVWLSFTNKSSRQDASSEVTPVADEVGAVEAWPTDARDEIVSKTEVLPRPVRNQKGAPCAEGLEVEFSGVCWVPVEQRPCPKQTLPYGGRCLLPVAKRRPEPTSIERKVPPAR